MPPFPTEEHQDYEVINMTFLGLEFFFLVLPAERRSKNCESCCCGGGGEQFAELVFSMFYYLLYKLTSGWDPLLFPLQKNFSFMNSLRDGILC